MQDHNFIDDNSQFWHGIIGQKRFKTEDEFAAAKDICIFGSHPHQVLLQIIFL